MHIEYKYYDEYCQEMERYMNETQNAPAASPDDTRLSKLESAFSKLLADMRPKPRYVFSQKRYIAFQKWAETARALAEHYSLNIRISYLEDYKQGGFIQLEGGMVLLSETAEDLQTDFAWVLTTASEAILMGVGELLQIKLFYNVYEKEIPGNAEKKPEA